MLLVLLALALRLFRLDLQGMRGDESYSVLLALRPLSAITSELIAKDPHPPVYYYALHYWMQIAGEREFVVRFPSVLFDVLAVPLVYSLGRSLFSRTVGLTAAGILAVSPFHLWNAQEVRMYTVAATLGLAATVMFVRALGLGIGPAGPRWRLLVPYTVLSVLGLYVHYYVVFILLSHNLAVLVRLGRNLPALGRWLLAQVGVIVLYLPWLVVALSVIEGYSGTGESPGFVALVERSLVAFGAGLTMETGLRPWLAVGFGLVLLAGVWRGAARWGITVLVPVLYLAVPVLAIFLASRERPIFSERYLLPAAPAYFILVGCVASAAFERTLPRVRDYALRGFALFALVAIAATSSVSTYNLHFNEAFAKGSDWRSAAAYVASGFQDGDVIVLNYPDPGFPYSLRPYNRDKDLIVLPSSGPMDEYKTGGEIDDLLRTHRRVWLTPIRAGNWDHNGFVEGRLDRRALKVAETSFRAVRLSLYESPAVASSHAEHLLDASFGGAVTLNGFDVWPSAPASSSVELNAKAGQTVALRLYWQALGPIGTDYKVFVHIADGRGLTIGQHDHMPADWTRPTSALLPGEIVLDKLDITIALSAPPGEYEVKLGMYDPGSGKRLPVGVLPGRPASDHETIARVNVVR